ICKIQHYSILLYLEYFIMIKLHYCSVKLFSSFNGEMTSGDFSSSSQHADQCVSDTSKCFGTYPLHTFITYGHLAAKGHPLCILLASGGKPLIGINGSS